MYEDLIHQYEAGGEKPALAIRGLTREDLLAVPDPKADVGLWTIQQVVIHLMDSELICIDRLKRMIAEENPPLIGYDENKFVQHLFYDEQSAEEAAKIIDMARANFARVLKKLSPATFDRPGQHNERGRITVGGYLKSTVEHLDRHVAFIHKKRAFMGKEMW
jgi:hypothetical protein